MKIACYLPSDYGYSHRKQELCVRWWSNFQIDDYLCGNFCLLLWLWMSVVLFHEDNTTITTLAWFWMGCKIGPCVPIFYCSMVIQIQVACTWLGTIVYRWRRELSSWYCIGGEDGVWLITAGGTRLVSHVFNGVSQFRWAEAFQLGLVYNSNWLGGC